MQTIAPSGIERYRKQPVEAERSAAGQLIDRANEIDIFDVLTQFFRIDVPSGGDSFKARCPFAHEHADGGLDKGWRVYSATNSSYCFVMHGILTPVRLIQIKDDIWAKEAAEKLLRHYDLLRPVPWQERAELLLEQRSRMDEPRVGSPTNAVEALQMHLQQVEGYDSRQFDADVQQAMEKILEVLDRVYERDDPEEALHLWFDRAKKYMTATVKKEAGTHP